MATGQRRLWSGADLKGEGVGMLAQLLDEPLLQPRQGLPVLGGRREGLYVGHKQVLAKGQAQDVQVLPPIAEGTGQRHIDCGGGALRNSSRAATPTPHPRVAMARAWEGSSKAQGFDQELRAEVKLLCILGGQVGQRGLGWGRSESTVVRHLP